MVKSILILLALVLTQHMDLGHATSQADTIIDVTCHVTKDNHIRCTGSDVDQNALIKELIDRTVTARGIQLKKSVRILQSASQDEYSNLLTKYGMDRADELNSVDHFISSLGFTEESDVSSTLKPDVTLGFLATDELIVLSPPPLNFTRTVIHEMTHVLEVQNGLFSTAPGDYEDIFGEQAFVYWANIEGPASAIEHLLSEKNNRTRNTSVRYSKRQKLLSAATSGPYIYGRRYYRKLALEHGSEAYSERAGSSRSLLGLEEINSNRFDSRIETLSRKYQELGHFWAMIAFIGWGAKQNELEEALSLLRYSSYQLNKTDTKRCASLIFLFDEVPQSFVDRLEKIKIKDVNYDDNEVRVETCELS